MKPVAVLFVCLGNICRSPTVEAVFRHQVEHAGLASRIRVDSCGTAGYHVGKAPDSRTIAAGASRGYELSGLRARQLSEDDFREFDYILAMDEDNLVNIRHLVPGVQQSSAHIDLFLRLAGDEAPASLSVPDPYYGGKDGFDHVLDLAEQGSVALLDYLRSRHPELG